MNHRAVRGPLVSVDSRQADPQGYTKRERHDFLYYEPTRMKIAGINMTYEGLIPRIQKSMLAKDREAMQPHIRRRSVDEAVTFTVCPDCAGTRLSDGARSSRIGGSSIAGACAMQMSDLAEWVRGLDEPSVAPLLDGAPGDVRFVRRDRARLPLARPAVGNALGW